MKAVRILATVVAFTLALRARPAMGRFSAMLALGGFTILAVLGAAPAFAQAPPAAAPADTSAPAPSTPPKLGAAELEKLLMPIALYPDTLIATMLPAAVYPLEIVQAAQFLANTNNASKIDQQPWDENVKAVARVPAALKKMNDDLQWTMQLGEAFLNQDKDVMNTIQALRKKAQTAGTLKTTEQQIVVVTNTIVQIQPANPQVVYVPTYPPTVYAPPPGPPPVLTFAAGVAAGAIIANNCDWDGGGVWRGGGYHGDVDVNVNNSVNIDNSRGDTTINKGGNTATQNKTAQGGQKWKPDQNRVQASGSPSSAKSMQSRGWSSGSANAAARPSAQPATGDRAGGATASAKPATPSAGARAATPSAAARPSPAPSPAARPSAGSPSAGNSAASAGASPSPSASRSSAFSGGGEANKQASQRGGASRGSGGGGASGGSRSGGGRR
jgi:hypothetical protein